MDRREVDEQDALCDTLVRAPPRDRLLEYPLQHVVLRRPLVVNSGLSASATRSLTGRPSQLSPNSSIFARRASSSGVRNPAVVHTFFFAPLISAPTSLYTRTEKVRRLANTHGNVTRDGSRAEDVREEDEDRAVLDDVHREPDREVKVVLLAACAAHQPSDARIT